MRVDSCIQLYIVAITVYSITLFWLFFDYLFLLILSYDSNFFFIINHFRYVKVYLLPDRSKSGKRKTKVKRHTLSPVFEEILKVRKITFMYSSLLLRFQPIIKIDNKKLTRWKSVIWHIFKLQFTAHVFKLTAAIMRSRPNVSIHFSRMLFIFED